MTKLRLISICSSEKDELGATEEIVAFCELPSLITVLLQVRNTTLGDHGFQFIW